jgi:hypothetical protein
VGGRRACEFCLLDLEIRFLGVVKSDVDYLSLSIMEFMISLELKVAGESRDADGTLLPISN